MTRSPRSRLAERWLAPGIGITFLVAYLTSCGPTAPPVPRAPEVAPLPSYLPSPQPSRVRRTPRPTPTPTPFATPTPSIDCDRPGSQLSTPPDRDITNEPLTRLINECTPDDLVSAIQLTDAARVELERGTAEKAVDLLEQAIRISPRAVAPYVIFARADLAEGQTERARSHLGRAAALSPEPVWLAEIIALNGVSYESDGKLEAAAAAYAHALQVFPGNRTAREGADRLKR
jgi:tetratricopeptide (TPR) repeat protein